MKKRYIIIGIIIVVILGFVIYKILSVQLFDNNSVILKELTIPDKSYSIVVYSFPSSATIQGSIQVHAKYPDGEDRLLKNYDRYNKLISISNGDSILNLKLVDTISYEPKIDTFELRLP